MQISKDELFTDKNAIKSQYTFAEISSQTVAWMSALKEVESKEKELSKIISGEYHQIIFTGCGSTYYLSLTAAPLFQSETGLLCRAIPAGELLMNPETIYTDKKSLLIAISRSGSTSETVKVARDFKNQRRGPVISITNYDNQPLTNISDLSLCITDGQEKSVAQTRSFSSMLVAATAVSMLASNKLDLLDKMGELPQLGRNMLVRYQDFAKELGGNLDIEQFFFLGSGKRYGIACEANLKMKEMSQTYTEPYHFLEFRHGPKSMVNGKTAIVGLLSDGNRGYEDKVLYEMKELGAYIISLAEHSADVSFESGLEENIRIILYLPVLQLMSYYRSLAKGLDPDNPRNLSSVIHLD